MKTPVDDADVEAAAHALHKREMERAALTSTVFSKAAGKPIVDRVEPFEEFAEQWRGDARAALEAAVRRDGWREIASAPRDGTRILLFCRPNEVPSLRPHIAHGYWQSGRGTFISGFWRLDHAVGPSFEPIFWMPEIPPPPLPAPSPPGSDA